MNDMVHLDRTHVYDMGVLPFPHWSNARTSLASVHKHCVSKPTDRVELVASPEGPLSPSFTEYSPACSVRVVCAKRVQFIIHALIIISERTNVQLSCQQDPFLQATLSSTFMNYSILKNSFFSRKLFGNWLH